MAPCVFNGCSKAAVTADTKCAFHMHRGQCRVPDCHNQVYARNLCVRHGGKRQCQVEGCTVNSRVGHFCTKHSPIDVLKHCSLAGCQRQAHLRGRCFRHGGGRLCKVEGCATYARNRGWCRRHSPRTSPSAPQTSGQDYKSSPPQTPSTNVQPSPRPTALRPLYPHDQSLPTPVPPPYSPRYRALPTGRLPGLHTWLPHLDCVRRRPPLVVELTFAATNAYLESVDLRDFPDLDSNL